jgi:hypothetical protein
MISMSFVVIASASSILFQFNSTETAFVHATDQKKKYNFGNAVAVP